MLKGFLYIVCLFVIGSTSAQEIKHSHSIHHSFIENKGQWDKDVLFQSKFDGGNLWIQQNKMVFHLQDFRDMADNHAGKRTKSAPQNHQTVFHVNFLNSNKVTQIEKSNRTTNYYNYIKGNDKSKWASEVYGYGEAILKSFYDGIDLKLIESKEQLKYEFHVEPEFNTEVIRFEYVGHESLTLSKKGNLIVKTILGEVIEEKPYAYQIVNGKIKEVTCAFELENDVVSFKLGNYNKSVRLIIDPVLIFATYCGSVSDNFGMTATYGYDGTAYAGGMVYGNDYPTPDNAAYNVNSNFTAAANTYGVTDVFITKYNPDGTNMLWTTFLGGGNGVDGSETAHSMICDSLNNLYVYGVTSSTDFPMQNPYQNTHGGGVANLNFQNNGVYFNSQGTDIYVAKISENGHDLMGSTYVGGSANDGVNHVSANYVSTFAYDSLLFNYGDQFRGEITLNANGDVVVASCTRSNDFPTANATQNTNAGQQDGVIFELSNNLSTMNWSTYFGGSSNDACYSIKVNDIGEYVFAGGTSSSDLSSTTSGWMPAYNGGKTDGFVGRLDATSVLQAVTYLGTSNYDQAFFVEVDRANNVYVVGQSEGGTFPVQNSAYVNPGSSQFLVKLDSSLTNVIHSTVLGNGDPTINISPSAFLVDICGNIYISGWGANLFIGVGLDGMPISSDAYQGNNGDGYNFYLMVIERDFQGLLYGSYLGGNQSQEHVDGGTSRFDKNGVVYQCVCAGCGGNSDFPTYPNPGAWSNQNLNTANNNCNNLVFKFDFELIPKAEFNVDNTEGCIPFTVQFDNISSTSDSYLWDFGNGDTTSIIFEPIVTFDTTGNYEVFLYVTDSICLITDTAKLTIYAYDSLSLNVTPDQELCIFNPIDLTAFTNGIANEFVWSTNSQWTDTLNTNSMDSIISVNPGVPTWYFVQVSNSGCSLYDSIFVDYIGSSITISGNDSLCLGDQSILTVTNNDPTINFTYQWYPDSIIIGSDTGTSITVEPNVDQYVFVTASSSTGCIVYDSIQIHVGNIPDNLINATASEYNVPTGGETELIGSPSGYSYQWTPTQGVQNPTAQVTLATVDQSTLFTLSVSDGVCTKSDTVQINVFEFICDDPYIYIPNAFSPNGDGNNDVLFVRGPFTEITFRIFDRWGEMVFESFSRTDGWDGTFRGRELDPDVYDYYLEVTCVGGDENIIKGNITLLR